MLHSLSNVADSNPVFILVDGHSLAFRSYYGLRLQTSTGIPTSVCYGFLKSLLDVMATYQPEYMAIAFDRAEPTFRHQADENYKADRAETPEDFIIDLENLKALLVAFQFSVVTYAGYEADDILGTLAKQGSEAGYQVKILSGDQDLFQLINREKNISVLHLSHGKGSTPIEFYAEQVYEKLHIQPEQVIDYKALCGDKSDNIPGVRGVGAKTAVKLLKDYGSLDAIYASLEEIKGATQKKLREGQEAAYHSQHLARIVQDIDLDTRLEDCQLKPLETQQIIPLLKQLEFTSFINQVNKIQDQFEGLAGVHFSSLSPPNKTIEMQADEELEADESLWFFSSEETQLALESQQQKWIEPQIIQTPQQLLELVEKLKTYTDMEHPVAWDTETTDLDPYKAKLVGIGCCWGSAKTDVAYLPISHKNGQNLELEIVQESLKPILESEDYPKVLQNAKFDRLVLKVQGINLAGVVFDPMLASYVLSPEESHSLSALSYKYLEDGIVSQSYGDLVPKGKTIADIAIKEVAEYCGMDVYTTYLLVPKLRGKLQNTPQLLKLLEAVEQPLEPILAAMEYTGIRINTEYLQQLSEQLEEQLLRIEKQAYEQAGTEFNLASPKQLSQLLFETLELDVKKSRKTKTGYSTDAKVLEKLRGEHPIIENILQHRTLAKLKSTYVDALPELVNPKTQRIHTDFNQTVTTTGRLSSSNPNLQNIPIRTEFSRQIRQAFIPEKGWQLVTADYSQIELRILAHLSQEPILVEAYQNAQDVHTLTAQLLFEKETVTSDERRLGKTINFGVIYGMGAQRFAREAQVSVSESKEFIERFNQRYPKVFEYLENEKRKAIAQGYVETLLGRRRYFDFSGGSLRELKGQPWETIDLDKLKRMNQNDAQLLRAAANAPIQGSSADIIKIAMVKLYDVLQDYQARLLLQVHDELVLEVPPNEWEALHSKIQSTMENAIKLTVPLVVDIHAGENWMEAK
jgi:DNA polymerase-1